MNVHAVHAKLLHWYRTDVAPEVSAMLMDAIEGKARLKFAGIATLKEGEAQGVSGVGLAIIPSHMVPMVKALLIHLGGQPTSDTHTLQRMPSADGN